MKIKKYTAPSTPEVMKKVRAELGSQAVILQSKTVYTGGFLGLFKKKNIEVVAAVDPNAVASSKQFDTKPVPAPVPASKELEQLPAASANVKQELADLKKLIMKMKTASAPEFLYPDVIKPVIDQLEWHGISRELQLLTAKHLLDRWSKEKIEEVTEQTVQKWAVSFLTDCLPASPDIQQEKVKYICLLGPTGVGKTTTLAKMASKKVLEEEKKVAFVTTDTYRIAAIEQLKTYAGLLTAPLKVAYSREDMNMAVTELSYADVIFIDTAGRNYLEKKHVEDLYQIVGNRQKASNYFLVLSAAAKEEDLEEVIKNFSPIQVDGFIFTKIDETKKKGTIINLMYTYKTGTSYVTNGQNVPDDIIKITNKMIVQSLFEG